VTLLKSIAKHAMLAVAPQATTALISARARAHSHRLVRDWGLLELNRRLIERFGSRVQSGPFRGLSLSELTRREHLGPFLLGTYEAELHPWIEQALRQQYEAVLDIGAKFGYYAVGLARHMRDTSVIAFDTDPWARRATREMAAFNETGNVSVSAYCSPRWLDRHLQPGSLVISDCEGFERELFLGARTPALNSATLIIEVHDALIHGAGAAIRQRFTRTHDISVVTETSRPVTAGVELDFLSPEDARVALREIRGPQEWLRLTPKVS